MASSSWFQGNVHIFGIEVHPITLMMVVGIAIQGIAECFLSPKWLEFASLQAPKGKEGTFLGFAHMNTFFAWLFGFILSGFLLAEYCPEPTTLSEAVQAKARMCLMDNLSACISGTSARGVSEVLSISAMGVRTGISSFMS